MGFGTWNGTRPEPTSHSGLNRHVEKMACKSDNRIANYTEIRKFVDLNVIKLSFEVLRLQNGFQDSEWHDTRTHTSLSTK